MALQMKPNLISANYVVQIPGVVGHAKEINYLHKSSSTWQSLTSVCLCAHNYTKVAVCLLTNILMTLLFKFKIIYLALK